MSEKEYSLKDYICLNYQSKKECGNCDGFGRNNEFKMMSSSSRNIYIKECYNPLKDINENFKIRK